MVNVTIYTIHGSYGYVSGTRRQVIYYGFILCSLTLTGLAGFINYALIGAKRDTITRMGGSTGQLPLEDSANNGVMIAGLFSAVFCFFYRRCSESESWAGMIIASDYPQLRISILSYSG